jgi:c-di-GMP-binding flagellar brake protein YcgR
MATKGVDTPLLNRRREFRVPVHFPILVRGTDRDGQWFEEQTIVENLSGGGAAFTTQNALDRGAMIYVCIPESPSEEPNREFSTKAQIVYFKPRKDSQGTMIGVKFIGPRFQRSAVSVWA